MTRFETLQGESLGVTFFAGSALGKVKFLCKSELQTLWSLDEGEFVVSDNGWSGSVADLLDLFSGLSQCPDVEMARRGWADRLDSGLALQTCVSDSGELFHTR
jgi:hypothetical protein